MISITVKSYANMRKYTSHLSAEGKINIPAGTTVAALLKSLKVPYGATPLVTIINGRREAPGYVLQPGDSLAFFPPLEGG
jgi:molybdopterin converting factor small subunit